MENPQFDVMRYAEKFKSQLGIGSAKISLNELGKKLGIENPEAHRALADAITTAKIFLKLKEMDVQAEPASIDKMISGFDDWA